MSGISETDARCAAFESWLIEAGEARDLGTWSTHVRECDACSRQWLAHTVLVAAFAAEPAPRLSPTFRVQLPAEPVPRPTRRPLTGWRTLALLGYAVVALTVLAWSLRKVQLPAVDLSSPWLAVAALVVVPATFALAIVVSRWLPLRRLTLGPTMFVV